MSCSSLYCTLYSLKQNKNMSPRTHKFTMHAVTFLKGLRCRCSNGNHQAYVSPSAVTQKHSTFRCIRYDALLGSGLGFFFFFFLSCNKILLRQLGKSERSSLACMNWPHVKTSIWLSSVGTYLLGCVGIFCLMLLRTVTLHKTRR